MNIFILLGAGLLTFGVLQETLLKPKEKKVTVSDPPKTKVSDPPVTDPAKPKEESPAA